MIHSLIAMSRARVGNLVPDQWGGRAHHPPILFFPVEYAHDVCLDSTGTGPAACASLRCVSVTATVGGILGSLHRGSLCTMVCNPFDPNPPSSVR